MSKTRPSLLTVPQKAGQQSLQESSRVARSHESKQQFCDDPNCLIMGKSESGCSELLVSFTLTAEKELLELGSECAHSKWAGARQYTVWTPVRKRKKLRKANQSGSTHTVAGIHHTNSALYTVRVQRKMISAAAKLSCRWARLPAVSLWPFWGFVKCEKAAKIEDLKSLFFLHTLISNRFLILIKSHSDLEKQFSGDLQIIPCL